jgi:hypothetical protein
MYFLKNQLIILSIIKNNNKEIDFELNNFLKKIKIQILFLVSN